MSSWKRGFLEIIAEVLECLINNSLKKTHITFKCNLDSRAVTRYLEIMISVGLVERSSDDKSFYVITQKGIKYRNQFRAFVSLVEDDLSKISKRERFATVLIPNIK